MLESILHTQDNLRLRVIRHTVDREKGLVCLIHGLGEHAGRYAHVVKFLNKKRYSVALIDLRGHGVSDGKRGHAPDYFGLMDDLSRFVAAMSETSSHVFIYGHSFGGNLAVNFALRQCPNVCGIVAASPAFKPAFKPPAWKLTLGKLAYRVLPSVVLSNELNVHDISRDSQVVAQYVNDPLVHNRLSARLGLDILKSGQWALDNAHRLTLPMLVMHGTEDRLTSCQASQLFVERTKGRADIKVWEGLFHETHNEPEQKEVLMCVVDWLDRQLDQAQAI